MSDEGATRDRRTPWWIKAFVAFHIVAITAWALPQQPPAVIQGKVAPRGSEWLLFWNARYLRPSLPVVAYLLPTGFWQYWDMFAPNPASQDTYGDGFVTFRDGTVKRWRYPRIFELDIPTKYVKERYRKFYERAFLDQNAYMWSTFAQRAALETYKDPKNPPVKVVLRRNWMIVAGPGKPQPTEYNRFEYFTYAVDLARLRREAGF